MRWGLGAVSRARPKDHPSVAQPWVVVRDELVERGLAIRHTLMALPDRFIDHGDQKKLLAENGLGVEDVKAAVRALAKSRR